MQRLFSPSKVLLPSAIAALLLQQNVFHSEAMQDDKDAKLIKVVGIYRHGARTPISSNIPNDQVRKTVWNNCVPYNTTLSQVESNLSSELLGLSSMTYFDQSKEAMDGSKFNDHDYYFHIQGHPNEEELLGNCFRGQLTVEGMKQLESLGKDFFAQYRKYISPDHSNMYVRCSDVSTRRTELSAIHFLYGLFSSMKSGLQNDLLIHRLDSSYENMYPNPKIFPEISHLLKSARSRDNEKHGNFQKDILQLLSTRVQYGYESSSDPHHSLPTFEGLHNTFDMMKYHGKQMPKGLTDVHLSNIQNIVCETTIQMFDTSTESGLNLTKMGVGLFMRDLKSRIDDTIREDRNNRLKQTSIDLYFGHDTTLVPLLTLLNVRGFTWPKTGSHLVIEVYESAPKEYYVKLKFDDKLKKVMKYSDFEQHIEPYITFTER